MMPLTIGGPPLRLAIWSAFAAALMVSAFLYLEGVRHNDIESAYGRAEGAARNAERALLRTYEAERGVQELLLLRQRLIISGDIDALESVEAQIRLVVAERRRGILSVFASDLNGRVSWSDNPAFNGLDISDRAYFRDLFGPDAPLVSVSGPLRARTTGAWRVFAARLVRDAAGHPLGVGATVVDPHHLSIELADIASAPGQIVAILHRADGSVRAHSRAAEAHLAAAPRPDHPVIASVGGAAEGRGELVGRDGIRRFGVWRATAELPHVIMSGFEWDIELAEYRRIRAIIIAAVIILLALSLWLLIAWDRNAALSRRLALEAALDPLTGLHNRRALARAAEAALTHRPDRPPVSLLLFDLDHFGDFNSRFGHAGGDAALRGVADALRREVRPGDVVCRWGGEEIAILLQDCPPELALRRAEAMRRVIEGNILPGLDRVTASVGVASAPRFGATLDALAAQADRALYAAKRAGRNRVVMAEAA